MASKNCPVPVELAEDHFPGRLTIFVGLAVFMLCLTDVRSAFAGDLKALSLVFEAGKFISALEFWGFLGFVTYIPLPKMMLGVVVTLGGAFLPEIPVIGKTKPAMGSVDVNVSKVAKLRFNGAPRYAVLAIGILIVILSLWDGATGYVSAR